MHVLNWYKNCLKLHISNTVSESTQEMHIARKLAGTRVTTTMLTGCFWQMTGLGMEDCIWARPLKTVTCAFSIYETFLPVTTRDSYGNMVYEHVDPTVEWHQHRRYRPIWAGRHRRWPVRDWGQVVVSDESKGARCSSVVRAFAHGAMGHRIDPSWGEPIELFLVPASAPWLV